MPGEWIPLAGNYPLSPYQLRTTSCLQRYLTNGIQTHGWVRPLRMHLPTAPRTPMQTPHVTLNGYADANLMVTAIGKEKLNCLTSYQVHACNRPVADDTDCD